MIHGGPRYLEFDWDTTRLSTQDAGYIVTIARNLVYRVVFLIPVLPHDKNNIERMETAMEVYDRFQPLKKAHPHRRLTPEEALQAEPGLTPDLVGAVTMEEWGVDPHRLVVAHAGFTLLGTTDDDFYGDLDSVEVVEDEVDYLIQAFERVFPTIRQYRPVRTTTGVRPTLFKWRRYEDELSRRYEVIDHTREGADGFITIAGGKLSMYRLMAEETSNAACQKLGHQAGGTTATKPLPGNESDTEPVAELAARCGISALAALKLQSRHGSNAEKVLDEGRTSRILCR